MTTDERLPGVSAVVLNYSGRNLLEIVLPSLAAQHEVPLETIVVDNGSRDDSLAYLGEHWPEVRVVGIPENIGVARALNRGVQASRGEIVALLNNDVELTPEWLTELLAALERHPRASSVTGKLRSYHDRTRLDGTGDVLTDAITAHRRGGGESDTGQYDREEEVFAPTAGASLYRASALQEVGPFDESFWAYFEDVDWGLRAQLLGYSCVYAPTAVAFHMGGATTGGDRDPFYYTLHRRNLIGLIVKDVPLSLLARRVQPIAREQVGGLVYSARNGMLRPHLRALVQALQQMPGWLRARRRIQGARRISARQLETLLTEPRG